MGSERASEGTSPYERVVPLLLMAPSAEASQYPCPGRVRGNADNWRVDLHVRLEVPVATP